MPTLDDLSTGLGQVADIYGQYRTLRDRFENPGVDPNYVDITRPGESVSTRTTGVGEVTAPLTQGIVGDARSLYEAGPAPLNPLLAQYYDQASPVAAQQDILGTQGAGTLQGILAGTDPATARLASQAADRVGTGAALSGAAGSARAGRAAAAGAADVGAQRQLQALGLVPTAQAALGAGQNTRNVAGQQYQNWQDTADWQNLGRYQQAIGFGQHSPVTTTSIETPSGADQYRAKYDALTANANLPEHLQGQLTAGAGGQARPTGTAATLEQIGTGLELVDTAIDAWDTVSGWF